MKDHNKHKFKGIITGFFHQLLQIDFIRYVLVRLRFIYFVKIKRRLKTLDQVSKGVASNTIMHNMKGLSDYAAVRPLALIKPLSVIETLTKDATILSIGPRTEGELFSLVGYGFYAKNIRGLDLITYSPWVDIGDMHKMPYGDSSYDVIMAGWVIAYSHTPEIAAQEMIRVVKNGGIIAIGVQHTGHQKKEEILPYISGAGRETSRVDEITDYFGDNIDHIYFHHEIVADRMSVKGSVLAIFSVKKQNE